MRQLETITLGGGCFWCVEAVFDDLLGVKDVVSGYMGGQSASPTYEDICTGRTGHAEVIQVQFDPATISLREIIEVFFAVHDPTTLNRQGNDAGTQYRSRIYYTDAEQQRMAEAVLAEANAAQGGRVDGWTPNCCHWRTTRVPRTTTSTISPTIRGRATVPSSSPRRSRSSSARSLRASAAADGSGSEPLAHPSARVEPITQPVV